MLPGPGYVLPTTQFRIKWNLIPYLFILAGSAPSRKDSGDMRTTCAIPLMGYGIDQYGLHMAYGSFFGGGARQNKKGICAPRDLGWGASAHKRWKTTEDKDVWP